MLLHRNIEVKHQIVYQDNDLIDKNSKISVNQKDEKKFKESKVL